jgi:hypothetical protein
MWVGLGHGFLADRSIDFAWKTRLEIVFLVVAVVATSGVMSKLVMLSFRPTMLTSKNTHTPIVSMNETTERLDMYGFMYDYHADCWKTKLLVHTTLLQT